MRKERGGEERGGKRRDITAGLIFISKSHDCRWEKREGRSGSHIGSQLVLQKIQQHLGGGSKIIPPSPPSIRQQRREKGKKAEIGAYISKKPEGSGGGGTSLGRLLHKPHRNPEQEEGGKRPFHFGENYEEKR